MLPAVERNHEGEENESVMKKVNSDGIEEREESE